MAKLIMSLDNAVIREVPLDKERFTIGRKAHNDIQIDNLAVSGEHALIVTILNDSFLEDLGSTNGTLVNGNPVKKHILQTNDIIEIGKYKLKFGDTQVRATQTTTQSRPPPPAPTVPKQPEKLAAVQILTGPSAGKELELTKNLTTLGKPGVQVAVITRRPHGYFITHVEGANFPVINGKALDAQAHQLNDHDVIELAGVKMEFFFKNG
jgi:pSer/pThr/pTyr-binding forkhead associated (FHA) protein